MLIRLKISEYLYTIALYLVASFSLISAGFRSENNAMQSRAGGKNKRCCLGCQAEHDKEDTA